MLSGIKILNFFVSDHLKMLSANRGKNQTFQFLSLLTITAYTVQFVLVIACFLGQFGINSPS